MTDFIFKIIACVGLIIAGYSIGVLIRCQWDYLGTWFLLTGVIVVITLSYWVVFKED